MVILDEEGHVKAAGLAELLAEQGAQVEILTRGLYFALKGKVKELYRVGDCVAPRRADRAIHDGYRVWRSL